MNTILSTLLILALAIAILFDFIRILQYIKSRKLIAESNKWTENKFKEVNSKLTQIQTTVHLIHSMEEDGRVNHDKAIGISHAILKQNSLSVQQEFKMFKQLKEIQDTLRKIEKRK